MTVPPILYKYCDSRGFDILERLRLKVTPPKQFNDPFEFTPSTVPELRRRQAKKNVKDKEAMRELYRRFVSENGFQGNFRSFRQRDRENVGVLANGLIQKYPRMAADFRRNYVEIVSAEFGVVCLSEVPQDILMWAHYTHSHEGFVIGLDTSHPLFQRPQLYQVEYRDERALVDPALDPRDRRFREETEIVLRRKSSHWSYEKEWRQLRFLRSCECDDKGRGRPSFYASITPKALSCLILGCRFPQTEADRLTALLRQPRFAHIRVLKARLHDSEFKLVLEEQ